ncbi:hypothetical protein ACFP1Z_25270 [Streptomyces gamaensis]|uniref:Uncharacterized protein n=1 Tax=Streptomyces gamaensis TaxID=1763542 RepID=A0ABW0ZAR2_9ACTN
MRNGNVGKSLGAVWLLAVATLAVPGVALCGGTALSDVLASSTPFLASVAVATAMTAKRGSEAREARTSAQVAHI